MKDWKHHRRRKPTVGFAHHQTGPSHHSNSEGATARLSRYRQHRLPSSRPNLHITRNHDDDGISEEPSTNKNKKPAGKMHPLSWKIQLLTGLFICLVNGFLLLYVAWMLYSKKGMKIPGPVRLFFEEDYASAAQNHRHHHKVEKVWRYRRREQEVGNSTTAGTMIAVDDDTPHPIVVVGLPKAGTSSLFEFFACHGMYSQHWYCCGPQHRADRPGSGGPRFGPSYMSHCLLENLQEREQRKQDDQNSSTNRSNHSILDGCGDYDVYTELNGPYFSPSSTTTATPQRDNHPDESSPFHSTKGIFLPQHYHLEDLDEAAAGAVWILNHRPADDWIRSVLNVPARSLVERLQYEVLVKHALENKKTGKYQEYSMLVGSIRHIRNNKGHNSSFGSIPRWQREEAFLRDFYREHTQRVRDFVENHPGRRLILVDISDPNAGVQLGSQLGWWGSSTSADIVNVAKPRRASPSKARACWKRYNAAEYSHDS